MRVVRTHDAIEINDRPGCLRVFALGFVAGGTLGWGTLLSDYESIGVRDRVIVFLIATGVFAAGLHLLRTLPTVRARFEWTTNRFLYDSRAPFRRAVHLELPLRSLQGFDIEDSVDSDGDPWHQLRAIVDGQRPLPLHATTTRDRAQLEGIIEEIGEARRVRSRRL